MAYQFTKKVIPLINSRRNSKKTKSVPCASGRGASSAWSPAAIASDFQAVSRAALKMASAPIVGTKMRKMLRRL